MAVSGGAIVLLIVLVLLIVTCVAGALYYSRQLRLCENSESRLCPAYHCKYTDPHCANGADVSGKSGAAYRKDAEGQIQCQTYRLPVTTGTGYTAADRANWPPPA